MSVLNFIESCFKKKEIIQELFSRAYMGVKMSDNNDLILGQNFSVLLNVDVVL